LARREHDARADRGAQGRAQGQSGAVPGGLSRSPG
jgi:hypothetical protein